MSFDPARETVRALNEVGGTLRRAPRPGVRFPRKIVPVSPGRAAVRAQNAVGSLTRGRSLGNAAGAAAAFRNRAARKIQQRTLGGLGTKAATLTKVRPRLPKIPKIPGAGLVNKALPILSTVGLVYDAIGFAESQAPGVHSWLRGGWKGVKPVEITIDFDGGLCSTTYIATIDRRFQRNPSGIFTSPPISGPIGGFRPIPGGSGNYSVEYYSLRTEKWVPISGGGSVSPLNPIIGINSVVLERVDGLPDQCGPPIQTANPKPYPDRSTTPTQSLPPTDNHPGRTGRPPTPTLEPPTQPGDDSKRDPSQPPNLGNLPFIPLIPGRAPDNQDDPSREQTPPQGLPDGSNCSGGCNATLRAGQETLNTQLNQQQNKLDDLLKKFDAAAQAESLRRLQIIDDKLGPQILGPTGGKIGIAGKLINFAESADKWFKRLGGDRALQALTLAATLHNAAMLSNNLGQTLTAAISNVLASVGIKDPDGNPFDIGQILGQRWQDFVVSTIGLENYTQLSQTWLRANRIMQAGANIINSIQSIRMSIIGALETIGSMSARIGNALKKFGVVGDSAYPWFNPSPNYDNRFFQALDTAENFTSNIDQIASEVLSAQETVTQLGQQRQELKTSLENGEEQPLPDNVQQYLKRQQEKAASESVDIESADFIKPDPEV